MSCERKHCSLWMPRHVKASTNLISVAMSQQGECHSQLQTGAALEDARSYRGAPEFCCYYSCAASAHQRQSHKKQAPLLNCSTSW